MIKNFLIGLGLTTLTVVVLQLLIIGFGIELEAGDRAESVIVPFITGVVFSAISLMPKNI